MSRTTSSKMAEYLGCNLAVMRILMVAKYWRVETECQVTTNLMLHSCTWHETVCHLNQTCNQLSKHTMCNALCWHEQLWVRKHNLFKQYSLRFNGHFPGEPGLVSVYWSFFTGRMPFLSPSQQCQSTEGNLQLINCGIYIAICICFVIPWTKNVNTCYVLVLL